MNILLNKLSILAILFLYANTALAGLVDLSTWSEEGPGGGSWTVAGDNNSVIQSVNSATPTFFISDDPFINSVFTGTIAVETTGDDDFIGFVFGYQQPFSGNGDATTDFDFLLFDWKQANQDTGTEGFYLSQVSGDFSDNGISHTVLTTNNPFWSHVDNNDGNSSFTLLDALTGAGQGWQDNTIYNFELTFQTNLLEIVIDGGDFNNQTIFSMAGSYTAGSFGFYNFSQAGVRYAAITEDVAPLRMTEPSSIVLLFVAIAGLCTRKIAKYND